MRRFVSNTEYPLALAQFQDTLAGPGGPGVCRFETLRSWLRGSARASSESPRCAMATRAAAAGRNTEGTEQQRGRPTAHPHHSRLDRQTACVGGLLVCRADDTTGSRAWQRNGQLLPDTASVGTPMLGVGAELGTADAVPESGQQSQYSLATAASTVSGLEARIGGHRRFWSFLTSK